MTTTQTTDEALVLRADRADGLTTLTLNRPNAFNSLSKDLLGALQAELDAIAALADLPALARSHEVRAPALLVIGEVAAYANTLHWFGREPLTSMTAASPSLAAAA